MSTEIGPFVLDELIGSGGMGQVWSARDTEHDDRRVALKLLPAGVVDQEEFVARFRREARLASRLNHPNIVPVLRYGEVDGTLYLAMPLLGGTDLSALVSAGAMAAARAVLIVTQIADALDAAHTDGLVHRDVKPSNVRVVGPRDFAYLLDFGIARPVDGSRLTSTGDTVGTAAYMAPERFTSAATDHRADVYSLTGVLYTCLTGLPPYEAADFAHSAWAHLSAPPPQPSIVAAPWLAPFDAVIAHGMAKDPADRPSSAGALAALAAAASQRVAAPPDATAGTPDHAAPQASTDAPATTRPPGSWVDPTGNGPEHQASHPTTALDPHHPVAHPSSAGTPRSGAAGSGRRRTVLTAAVVVALGVAVAAALLVLGTGSTTGQSAGPPAGPPGAAGSASPPPSAPATVPPGPIGSPAPLAPGAVAEIAVGDQPFGVVASPDGRRVYVANELGPGVSVVDASTNTVVATIPTSGPSGMAVSPDGATLWVAGDDGLVVVDTARAAVRSIVALDDGGASDVALSRDGRHAWVPQLSGQLLDVDTTTATIARRLPAVPDAAGIALAPDGALAAVTTIGPGALELLDLRTGASRRLPLPGQTFGPVFSPDGRTVLVSDQDERRIAVIDVATARDQGTGPGDVLTAGVTTAPDSSAAYSHDDRGGGRLLVLDPSSGRIRRTVPVPSVNSATTAISPDGSRAYVVDQGARRLLVVALR